MSLRTIQRVGIASSLLLGAIWASGCDDDDGGTGTPADAGVGPDGGGDGDGDMTDAGDGDGDVVDAGNPDAGPGIPKMCEGQTEPCPTVPTGLLDLEGCCDVRVGGDGVGVCGGIVAIPGQKTALDGCHGLHQVGMQSDFCGAFFDAIEGESGDPAKPFDHANGKFDVLVAGSIVNFAGCCNETSICGVNVDSFDFGGQPVSPMLGCVPVDHFQAMMGGEEPAGDAGAGEVVPPFCVVDTDKGATCPPKLTVALPGQEPINLCDNLTAIGAIGCDPTAATPEWVCAANGLTSTKTGDVPVLAPPYEMEYILEIVHGCGDTPGTTCVPNVPANVYGAVDLDTLPDDAKGAVLAKVPDFVCGCGEGGADSPLCLHNVAVETCRR